VLIFIGLVALVIIQKRRNMGDNIGQNAPKDHSEALQLEPDGAALRSSMSAQNLTALNTRSHDDFDFENPEALGAIEVERPRTPGYSDNPNTSQNAHGTLL
jgi:hypothetical protein